MQAPREIQLCPLDVAAPEAGDIRVATRYSAISSGTEMLFYRGEAPEDVMVDSTLDVHGGALAYPLHYGYCAVGAVESCGALVDPALNHQRVFSFHPHTSAFVTNPAALIPIPDAVDDTRATFFANTETAVNLVQDGAPRVGERILVLGLGVVGTLTSAILTRIPGVTVVAVDPLANRRGAAEALGIAQTCTPEEAAALRDFDLVYELTGRPQTLAAAIAAAGFGARVVVGSWYGNKRAPLLLDTHFHRGRISILSSQVSTIAPELSGRWDKPRRYALVWRLLADLPVERLVSHVFPVARAAEAFEMVDQRPDAALQVLIEYAH